MSPLVASSGRLLMAVQKRAKMATRARAAVLPPVVLTRAGQSGSS
jgi:hypothetical protein